MKTFNVRGMHCTSCEILITDALKDVGAAKAKADWKKGIVQVAGIDDDNDDKVKEAIKSEGYEVV